MAAQDLLQPIIEHAWLNGFYSGQILLPHSNQLAFSSNGTVVYERYILPSSQITYSPDLTEAVVGSTVILQLVASGGTAPNFSAFKELNTSGIWDNRSGIVNLVMIQYFGENNIWYSIAQEENQVPLDVVAPTVLGIAATNGNSTVRITYSETLVASPLPAISSFSLGSGVISAIEISGSIVTLTLSTPVSTPATLSYTPPSLNPLRDVAGNLAAPLSNAAITVPVLAPLSFPDANRLSVVVSGTAPDLIYTAANGATSWVPKMRSTQSIPAGQDGWVMVRQPTLGGTVSVGLTETSTGVGDIYTAATLRAVHLHPGGFYWTGTTQLATTGAANDSFRVRRTAGVVTAERRPNGSTTWTTFHTFSGLSTAQLFANVVFTFANTSVARDVQGFGFS